MKSTAFVAAALLCAAPLRAQRAHIGAHGGYNFDSDRGLAGAQILLPVAPQVELYPSFDYYFVNGATALGFSGDLKVRLPLGSGADPYVGAGVNVLHSSAGGGGTSATDTGWDLVVGVESRRGVTHPYVEGRWLQHGGSQFQMLAGLNITLY